MLDFKLRPYIQEWSVVIISNVWLQANYITRETIVPFHNSRNHREDLSLNFQFLDNFPQMVPFHYSKHGEVFIRPKIGRVRCHLQTDNYVNTGKGFADVRYI